jgi:hypothetical protein
MNTHSSPKKPASPKPKGKLRIMAWTIGAIIALLAVAAIGLQIAISRDGPAVLTAVDRLTGPKASYLGTKGANGWRWPAPGYPVRARRELEFGHS